MRSGVGQGDQAGHPLPAWTYTAALVAGLTLTAAATLPVLCAARRDPLTELRIA